MAIDRGLKLLPVVLGMLMAGPLVLYGGSSRIDVAPLGDDLAISGCRHSDDQNLHWQPTLVGADHFVQANFDCSSAFLQISVGQYLMPSQGQEAITDLNEIAPRAIRFGGVRRSPGAVGFEVEEYASSKTPGRNIVIWSWYSIGDHPTPSPIVAKLLQMLDAARFVRQDASVIVMMAVGSDTAILRQTLNDRVGPVWSWFRSSRQSR